MSALNRTSLATDSSVTEPRRNVGSTILAYCIALPLFGRAVFPLARDKAHITLASSFTDPQIVATYLLAIVVAIKICTGNDLFKKISRVRVVQVFILFVAACLASSFGSRFPLLSFWRCIEVLLLAMWAVAMIRDATDAGDPSKAVRAFYRISVAILVGVFAGLIIDPSGAWSMEGDVARLTGTTGYSINSNDIGAIAAVIAVGSYVRAVELKSLRHTVATALFLAVCYLSHSRASYIALAFGFAVATFMLVRITQRRSIIFAMISFAAVALAALALVSDEVRGFFVFLMTRGHESQNLESLGGRLQLWEFGLKVFGQHPYLGTGYGIYPEGLEGGHFHNVLIELLVTTGLVGVVSYVAFLFALLAAMKRSIGQTNRELAAQRIMAADLMTIPAVIVAANGATAGAAYYSWDLLGLISVAVAASALMVTGGDQRQGRAVRARYSNLLP